MDPRFLPFQVAAGILLAAFVILLLRLGINVYRNNQSFKSLFGAAMFLGSFALGVAIVKAGFGQ